MQTPTHVWLAAGLMVLLGTLAALNVNTFAVHTGMADGMRAGTSVSGHPEPGAAPGAHPDGQDLLHLVGACLALLAAGLTVAPTLRGPARRRTAGVGCHGVAARFVHAWAWRGPPALTPPTTSPVIRT